MSSRSARAKARAAARGVPQTSSSAASTSSLSSAASSSASSRAPSPYPAISTAGAQAVQQQQQQQQFVADPRLELPGFDDFGADFNFEGLHTQSKAAFQFDNSATALSVQLQGFLRRLSVAVQKRQEWLQKHRRQPASAQSTAPHPSTVASGDKNTVEEASQIDDEMGLPNVQLAQVASQEGFEMLRYDRKAIEFVVVRLQRCLAEFEAKRSRACVAHNRLLIKQRASQRKRRSFAPASRDALLANIEPDSRLNSSDAAPADTSGSTGGCPPKKRTCEESDDACPSMNIYGQRIGSPTAPGVEDTLPPASPSALSNVFLATAGVMQFRQLKASGRTSVPECRVDPVVIGTQLFVPLWLLRPSFVSKFILANASSVICLRSINCFLNRCLWACACGASSPAVPQYTSWSKLDHNLREEDQTVRVHLFAKQPHHVPAFLQVNGHV